MTRQSSLPVLRTDSRYSAFTLIELLTVIAIILVLAALLLNVAGHAQYKAATSRAQGEIKQMETACESYKVDNGAYPRDSAASSSTDSLVASSSIPPDPSTYTAASTYLFQELSGAPLAATPTVYRKAYITFLPSQLKTTDSSALTTPPNPKVTYLIDPFGLSYGYSTANAKAMETVPVPNPAPGFNPTFDLWSTAGYGNGGKSYPAAIVTAGTQNSLWVKNW